jgi:hypothetical protein
LPDPDLAKRKRKKTSWHWRCLLRIEWRSSGFPQTKKIDRDLQHSHKTEETSRANFMPSSLQRQPQELVVGPVHRWWPNYKNRAAIFAAQSKVESQFYAALGCKSGEASQAEVTMLSIRQFFSLMNSEFNTVKRYARCHIRTQVG